jgi:hypothetical protein
LVLIDVFDDVASAVTNEKRDAQHAGIAFQTPLELGKVS